MNNVCKVCKEPFERYAELKAHFGDAHQEQFVQIERWVDETTIGKVRSYEELAAQGLLGLKEDRR